MLFDETLALCGLSEVPALDPETKAALEARAAQLQTQGGSGPAGSATRPSPLTRALDWGVSWGVALVSPQPKESKLVKISRDMITLPVKMLLPFMMPLFAFVVDGYAGRVV